MQMLINVLELLAVRTITWNLLVELKGISQIFGLLLRNSLILPRDISIHLRSADSDASPLHSLKQCFTSE